MITAPIGLVSPSKIHPYLGDHNRKIVWPNGQDADHQYYICFFSHSSSRSCFAVCRFYGFHYNILLINGRNSFFSELSRFLSNCSKETGGGTLIPAWNSPWEQIHSVRTGCTRKRGRRRDWPLLRKEPGPQRSTSHEPWRWRT